MKKRTGSAVIITIFLITVVGSTALGMGRLLNLGIETAAVYESGLPAYFAAESGLEEGFLRWRLKQNSNVPHADWLANANNVFRSDLSQSELNFNGEAGINQNSDIDSSKSANQLYDLRFGSLVSIFGPADLATNNYCASAEANFCILRDESKKFSVDFSDQDKKDLDLLFVPYDDNTLTAPAVFADNEKCVLVEAKIIGKENGKNIDEKKMIFYNSSCNYSSIINVNEDDNQAYNISEPPLFKIEKLKSKIWPSISLEPGTELYLKPIGANIIFSLAPNNAAGTTADLYGPTAEIQSVGYFGGASRTLSASIDRQSGTLYDLFDYVIYRAK